MNINGVFIIILLFPFLSIAQDESNIIELKINSSELNRINYKNKHKSWSNVEKTGTEVLQFAQNKGFLTAFYDTVKKNNTYLELDLITPQKYTIGQIHISDSLLKILKPNLKEKQLTQQNLSIENINDIHTSILSYYENHGYPFAKSNFENITIEKGVFTATLAIHQGTQFIYDSLIVKSDKKIISHKLLSNYLHIKTGEHYNEKNLEKISERINALQFLNEVKSHEIIFQKNKATVYVYLEKNKSSNANGIIGIQPDNQTGKINITGEVQVQLKNAFKIAETIDLEWRKLQPQTQDLDIHIQFPMLFNTPFGVDGAFNLYKRDTSFLDISGQAGVIYTLSNFNQIGVFYKYENSQILNSIQNPQSLGITPVKKNHFGISSQFQKFDNFRNPTRGYKIFGEVSFVTRTITNYEDDSIAIERRNNAYEFNIEAEGFIPLGLRNTIKVGAKGIYQFAPNLYRNELFRIGGLNSLRGFDEESINVSSAVIATLEYRFLLDRFSNIFAFIDYAGYESDAVDNYIKDYPFGFGLGINFSTNFGTFSLTYALGKQLDNPIRFRSGKIHFGYINTF